MTSIELTKHYWRYYLMLEKRFLETVENVEIHTQNFSAFSNGYAMLIQAIGAELDNVFKVYCGIALTERNKNITDYANFILSDYPGITTQNVKVINRDIILIPFEQWDLLRPAQSLPWWEAFCDIKHNRYGNLQEANQGNVLKMLAALYLLEMKCYKKFVHLNSQNTPDEPDMPAEESKIFSLENWEIRYMPIGKLFAVIDGAFTMSS